MLCIDSIGTKEMHFEFEFEVKSGNFMVPRPKHIKVENAVAISDDGC